MIIIIITRNYYEKAFIFFCIAHITLLNTNLNLVPLFLQLIPYGMSVTSDTGGSQSGASICTFYSPRVCFLSSTEDTDLGTETTPEL